MSEDDVRNFLNKQTRPLQIQRNPTKVGRKVAARRPQKAEAQEGYKNFSATHLYCPTCRQAMPVREKLMLYLPDGDLYDYLCSQCGTSVGTRKAGQ